MVRASEQSGKLYMVSQSRRYDGRLAAFRRLIEREAGQIGILNSDFYIGAHFGGFRDEMPSPLILDMAIHTLDAARYLSGTDPVSVYCEEYNPNWSWYTGDACATALFTMTGGLRYTYRGSWCAEGKPTSWEADWRASPARMARRSGMGQGRRRRTSSRNRTGSNPKHALKQRRSTQVWPAASPGPSATSCTPWKQVRFRWASVTTISRASRWSSRQSSRRRRGSECPWRL